MVSGMSITPYDEGCVKHVVRTGKHTGRSNVAGRTAVTPGWLQRRVLQKLSTTGGAMVSDAEWPALLSTVLMCHKVRILLPQTGSEAAPALRQSLHGATCNRGLVPNSSRHVRAGRCAGMQIDR